MASSYAKRLSTNERFIIHEDADYLRSKVIHCVGLENILEVFLGTKVLEDLRLLEDCKPASVSNWSFDENCLFCCLRREKVKEHVVALNKQIVESGGKPLLGKDLSNISRLEWQSEEFLNAVLHRKEYTPRIPDPHIPVVACDILQQMMNQLAMYYTSRNNHSQDSIQNNGNKDQSHLKTSSSPNTSSTTVDTAAAAAASATILMADQDAPLDLSIKRVKAENFEQDGVLDLSTKKIVNKGQTSFKHSHVSTATHLIKRDSVDPSLVQVKDLQSTSNLEQFMSKLCLHHQRQIVDALGFLQTEVKTVTSSNFQAPTPTISENQTTTSCSRVSFEARSEIQCSKKTCSVDAAVSITRPQESSIVRTNKKENVEILNANAPAMVEKPVDLCKMGVLSSSCGTGVECRNVSTSKFHSVFIMENTTSDHLRAKKLRQSIQHVGTDIVKKYPCLAERRLTCTAESDHAELSSKSIQRCSLAQNQDAVVKPATIQRTSNVVFPISSRTARKSRKTSCSRLRNGSSWRTIIEPDSHCDLVYIRKSITECQPPSHNRLHLRKNARKSTRGHKYIEEYLELKTVRTLAHKSVSDASGNCPAHMPDVTTSVTPRQFLSRPDSVPLVDAPFAGDCMKNVVLKLSNRLAENEVPGDVVKETNQGLMVETSQTGKIDSNDRISNLLACKQGKCTNQQDLIIEADGCASNTVLQENNKDIVRFKEKLECVVQKEGNDSQTEPIMKDVIYGLESKVDCQNEPLEPSLSSVSPNMAEDDSANGFSVEPTNDLKNQNLSDKITPDAQEQSEAMEKNTMDKSIQEQVLHNEFNLNPVNDFKLPKKDQEDSGVSGQMEMSTVQPLEKCEENGVVPDTWKDLDTKIVLAKQVVPSDRCLRSRGSKGSNDETKDSECGAAELDTKMTQANDENLKAPCLTQPLKSQRLNLPEANEHPEGEHNMKTSDILETAQRHSGAKLSNCLVVDQIVQTKCKEKATAVEKDEPHLTLNSVELPSLMSPGVVQEMMTVTSTTESEKTHTSSEKMLLRNRNGHTELAVSGENQSPVKKSPPNFENILLRSKSNIEQPFNSESSSSSLGSHLENQGQTPLRGVNYTSEQETDGDLCISPKRNTSESPMRMPLRSRTSSKIKEAVTTNFSEQSVSLHSSTTCRKAEDDGHMPLRSGTSSAAEQPISSKSVIGDTLDSPGRVSLRRGNMFITEKPCGSTTPPNRNGRPQRQQRVIKTVLNSSSLEVEPSPMNSRLKIQSPRNTDTQIKDSFYLSDESVDIANLLKTEPILSSPKFLQALRGEEHQQLISSLNTKFDKMHKGWVQMDKECQPAPKPKNKADRLKEIWKSKRRIRKTRPLEQQKFSPVQMLFMKPFDLPSICRWFLQSTETKSLVIVKKVNTRLPSETQLCFHSSAAGTGSSHGIFPSLQAERLKKHLKKFPIASPVKNNPKNQRLLSKALGRDISVVSSKEKHEPTSATRICTKAQSLIGVTQTQASEGPGTVTGSSKNPASVRILRKYSNIREKLQVQQSKKCKEKALKVTHLKTSVIPKNPAKQKLQTHKGSKSAVVQSIKSFSKKAKANSAVKERGLKKNLCYKDVISPKRLQALTKVAKANPEHASTNIQSKKEVLIKTVTEKAQQTKTSGGKVDIKKSVYNKGPNSLELQSLDIDMKPLSLEDQVLTRSQRKMDTTPSQTWSPKSSTKRGLDPLVTPTKRTRTSKQ